MAAVLIILLASIMLIFIGMYFDVKLIRNLGGVTLWLIMIMVAGFRYDGSDVDVYQLQFFLSSTHDWLFWNETYISKETAQPLFFYINKLFYVLELQFSTLRLCIEVIFMGVLGYIIYKYTTNWAIVYLLYLVIPFYADLIQTRNFIMSVFIFLAVVCMCERTMICRMKALCTIVGAGMFHSLGFIYFPFIFIDKVYRSVITKIIISISLLSPVYIYFIINNSYVFLSAFGLEDSPFAFYLAYSQGLVTSEINADPYKMFIRCWMLVVLCTLILNYIEKKVREKSSVEEKKRNFISNTKNIWLCVMLLLPTIGITPSMERLPRNILLPFYLSLGIYLEDASKKKVCMVTTICIVCELLYGGVIQNISKIMDEINSNYLMDFIDYF